MKQVKKILFPIDFSEKYEILAPWVATFAEKFDAAVYVVFVARDLSSFSSFHVPHGSIQSFQEEALKGAEKEMHAATQKFAKSFTKLHTKVLSGRPAEKILEFAQSQKVDLIIMGAHGRKGLEKAIFGSVADKVVAGAPCPVLTINPDRA